MRNKRIWNASKQLFEDLLDFGICDGTGLLDSTGREMFVNDIVKYKPNYDSDEYVCIIGYIERLGCYGLISPIHTCYCHTFHSNLICNDKICPSLTVVGNIYQNQDIIEEFNKSSEVKRQEKEKNIADTFTKLQKPYKVKKISKDKYSFFYEDKKYIARINDYNTWKYISIESNEIDGSLKLVRNILGIEFRSSSLRSGFIFSEVGWSPDGGFGGFKDINNHNVELVINKIKEGL